MTKDITVEIFEAPPACAYKRCIHWEGKIYAIENSDHAPLVPGVKVSARIDEDGIATIVEAAEEPAEDLTQLQAKDKETMRAFRDFMKSIVDASRVRPTFEEWSSIQQDAAKLLNPSEPSKPFIKQVLTILQSWGLAAKMGGDVSNPVICILHWEIQGNGGGWYLYKNGWTSGKPLTTLACPDEDKLTPAQLAGLIADTIRDNTNV